jgi:hypothetical protein
MSKPYYYYLIADRNFLTVVASLFEYTRSRPYKEKEIIHIIFSGKWKSIELEVRD